MTDYNKIEKVKNIILQVLEKMGFSGAAVEFEDSITKGLVFNINSPDSYLLIGRQGVHLHALQLVVQAMVQKQLAGEGPLWFSLDVDDYRMKREWFLKETIRAASEAARKTGRAQALEAMPNYERRFAHAFVQENLPDFTSDSIGEDPYRKVVIRLKR